MPEKFIQRVDRILKARDSLVCVGLDPDPTQMPKPLKRIPAARQLDRFLEGIVSSTYPHAAAYKMQMGFYLRYGPAGFTSLARICRKIGPTRLRILDLKANDIPNVMSQIRDGAFKSFGFDAVTVTPWMGWDSLQPFLDDATHGVFVIAHSSNPGAPDFQEIPTPRGPLWLAVVGEVRRLSHAHGNVGTVLGATFSDAFRSSGIRSRSSCPAWGRRGGPSRARFATASTPMGGRSW